MFDISNRFKISLQNPDFSLYEAILIEGNLLRITVIPPST